MENFKIMWVRENYKKLICNPDDIQSVVVGGSVARNYPDDEGDIDIIYFMKSQDMYRKEKRVEDDILIELHYVPLKFIFLLLETIEPIIDAEKWGINNSTGLDSLWGEKLCTYQKKTENNKFLLAAWRELKKLIDSIVIYDGDLWYEKNIQKYRNIKGDKRKILNIINKDINNMSSLESIIENFKFYSVTRGDVFSKVFWTDYYINSMNNSKIKSLMNTTFAIDDLSENTLVDWINIMQENLETAVLNHKMMRECSICKGQFEKCNIGRCSGDYLFDARRAVKRKYEISIVLCIRRSYEYLQKAYGMYGLKMIIPEGWNTYWGNVQERCDEYKDTIVQLLFDRVV